MYIVDNNDDNFDTLNKRWNSQILGVEDNLVRKRRLWGTYEARLLHIPESGISLRSCKIFRARWRPRPPSWVVVLSSSSSSSSSSPSAAKSSAPGSWARLRSRSAYAAFLQATEDAATFWWPGCGKGGTSVPGASDSDVLGWYDARLRASLGFVISGPIEMGTELTISAGL